MTDQDINKRTKEFFHGHEAGIALRERWERRVESYVKQLIREKDPKEVALLQAKIQYHQEVLAPELG